jgi:phage shock protein E
MLSSRSMLATGAAAIALFGLTGCGDSEADAAAELAAESTGQVEPSDANGIRVVAPEQAAQTIADPPDDLVILDVRTQDEFDEGHIDGAVLLDFYRDDFADRLAALDPTVPYVLYCRSGNRSGQARAIMDDLGFRAVEDIDGGIVGWQSAGLPVVAG